MNIYFHLAWWLLPSVVTFFGVLVPLLVTRNDPPFWAIRTFFFLTMGMLLSIISWIIAAVMK